MAKAPKHAVGKFDSLEPRLLLHAANGGDWAHPELVTVSFMPDGTELGGAPSSLFSTMNAKWSASTWQKEILRGVQSFAAVSNLNFSVVSDDGAPFGSAGQTGTDENKQGDSNFGDIRIGAFDLGPYLGIGMLPPDVNQDTTAGDFFLNSTTNWNIGNSYDLLTVATHEAGHVLGLDHSSYATAVEYSTYNGLKNVLTADDIAGIQAIYGARHEDALDTASSNDTKGNATVITSHIDSNKQVTLTSLDITNTSDADWYKITVPSGTTSTMTVKVQSAGLSLLAPKLSLYKSDGTLISSTSGTYSSTITLSTSIAKGKNYFIKAEGADTTVFGTGSYALQVNMGSAALPAINSPNTATAATGGGGSSSGQSAASCGLLCNVVNTVTSLLSPLEILEGLIQSGRADAYSTQDHGSNSHDHASGDAHTDHHATTHLVDHISEVDPVDVIRPTFALIKDLILRL